MLDDEDVEEPEDEELFEDELEADEEVDEDQWVSDEWEIEELANEVDVDLHLFIGASDLDLGQSAMTKVCSQLLVSCRSWLHLIGRWQS